MPAPVTALTRSQMTTDTAPTSSAHAIASDDEALAVARSQAAQIAPDASVRDRERRLPAPELAALKASGLLAITVPRTHGGADVTIPTLAEVFRILAAADPSIGQIPQNHFAAVEVLRLDGDEGQRASFYERLLEGALFGNATSERGTRDIFNDVRTRLTTRPDGTLRLDGRKYYSTGALFADWIPVFALDESDRLVAVFVERGAGGLEVRDDWSGMGQRVTASGTTILEDVTVAPEHVVQHWRTYEAPQVFGAFNQIMHVAIDVGIAEATLADTLEYVRTRSRPWFEGGFERAVDDPHVIKRVGELVVSLRAAQALLARAAETLEQVRSEPVTEASTAAAVLAVAEAKAAATSAALDIAQDLFALAGTSATDDEHNLHRHWRNARTHTLHDPVRWKYHNIGNHALSGALPPSHGWL
jgi:SfnB family sulfur acquisition oxidoreductase